MSLVIPLVSPLIAGLTAAPGGSSLPQVSPPPPPPPPPPQPAVLAITQIGPQEAGGNVPVSYSIDKTDTGAAAVLYAATDPAPLAADFNGAGAPTYADLGTVTLDTSGTPLDLAIPDGLNGSYRLALLPTGGGDGDVAVSAPVTIDTTVAAPPPPDAMADDTGKLYWYGADATTRSGSSVTAMTDKGGNAFALTATPAAFGAPQQANASAPVTFTAPPPTIIQTATKAAGNRLMMTHLLGGGSLRFFAVVNGPSLGTGSASILAESADADSNNAIQFGVRKSGTTGNIQPTIVGRGMSYAFLSTDETTVHSSVGLFIYETLITQTTWQIRINGNSVLTGTVTSANFPTAASVRTSLGGRASDTAAQSVFTGDLHAVFVTRTSDDTHASAVRAQLATTFSITL